MTNAERVLFVHAHPDDESIDTGGTLATLIDRGASVTVLTCTRGERGEVIPDDLKAALDSQAALATLRETELTAALNALGVTDHRYLGNADARWNGKAPRVYLDSGMRWVAGRAAPPDTLDPASLSGAEFGDVAADIAAVVLAVHPDAIVSYDEDGGYGHPDHVRAHQAARRAADFYGVPFFSIVPERAVAERDTTTPVIAPTTHPGMVSVDVTPVLERKTAALGAYRSQLTLEGDTIVFPGGQRQPVGLVERYLPLYAPSDDSLPFSDQHPFARLVASVLAGVVGCAVGALLTVYNQSTATIGGQPIWIGVLVAILIVAALLLGFRLAFGTRVVAGFAAVGVIVVVGVFSFPSRGGSQLIFPNGPGITWQIAPVAIAALVLAWPQVHRRAPGKIAVQGPVAQP
jgi:N-acetyl-1-D-myo-inositol-2-amino-2-deoxy-alpha-D-glucopyranoside deacetylase